MPATKKIMFTMRRNTIQFTFQSMNNCVKNAGTCASVIKNDSSEPIASRMNMTTTVIAELSATAGSGPDFLSRGGRARH
jgi:hypothetical protein